MSTYLQLPFLQTISLFTHMHALLNRTKACVVALLLPLSAFAQSWNQVVPPLEFVNLSASETQIVANTRDQRIMRLSNGQWTQLTGGNTQNDVATHGNTYYCIGNDNRIWRSSGTGWAMTASGMATRIAAERGGTLWVVGTDGNAYSSTDGGNNWTRFGEVRRLIDIAAHNGTPYVVAGDNRILMGSNGSWQELPGGGLAKRIAVDGSTGAVFVIGMDDGVYYHTGTDWRPYGDGTGRAIDIAAQGGFPYCIGSGEKAVWKGSTKVEPPSMPTMPTMPTTPTVTPTVPSIPTTTPLLGGTASWQWVENTTKLLHVSADAANLVAVGADQRILRWNGTAWQHLAGGNTQNDVTTAGGRSFIVGNDNRIWQFGRGAWTVMQGNGLGKRLTADNQDKLWVIGTSNEIFSFNGSAWDKYPGGGIGLDIAAYNGVPFVVGMDQKIYRGTGAGFAEMPGDGRATRIAVDLSNGTIYVIGTDKGIYYHNGQIWVKYAGGEGQGVDITAQGGFPYVVGTDGFLWRGKVNVNTGFLFPATPAVTPPTTPTPTTPPVVTPPTPPAPPVNTNPNANGCVVPMADDAFNRGVQTIKQQSFSSTQKTVLRQVFSQNCVNTSQIKQVLKLFSFESDRMEIAKYLYPRCTNKEEYYLLNDSFSFSSSVEELARWVQQQR